MIWSLVRSPGPHGAVRRDKRVDPAWPVDSSVQAWRSEMEAQCGKMRYSGRRPHRALSAVRCTTLRLRVSHLSPCGRPPAPPPSLCGHAADRAGRTRLATLHKMGTAQFEFQPPNGRRWQFRAGAAAGTTAGVGWPLLRSCWPLGTASPRVGPSTWIRKVLRSRTTGAPQMEALGAAVAASQTLPNAPPKPLAQRPRAWRHGGCSAQTRLQPEGCSVVDAPLWQIARGVKQKPICTTPARGVDTSPCPAEPSQRSFSPAPRSAERAWR